jgi:hypothetical protein
LPYFLSARLSPAAEILVQQIGILSPSGGFRPAPDDGQPDSLYELRGLDGSRQRSMQASRTGRSKGIRFHQFRDPSFSASR